MITKAKTQNPKPTTEARRQGEKPEKTSCTAEARRRGGNLIWSESARYLPENYYKESDFEVMRQRKQKKQAEPRLIPLRQVIQGQPERAMGDLFFDHPITRSQLFVSLLCRYLSGYSVEADQVGEHGSDLK